MGLIDPSMVAFSPTVIDAEDKAMEMVLVIFLMVTDCVATSVKVSLSVTVRVTTYGPEVE